MVTTKPMKKTLKQFGIAAAFMSLAMLINSAVVSAQGFLGGGGATGSAPGAVLEATGGEGSFRSLALTVIGFFLGFLGLLAVIMIIYAGIMYVTA